MLLINHKAVNLKKLVKFIPVLAFILTLVNVGLILYFIVKYGVDVPYNDQWEYIGFFDNLSQGKLTFEELFRQHNEYRQLFPNLIFVGLGWFTHWNVRYEMFVIFILACLVSFNVYRLASITAIGESWQKWVMFFLANLFIFSPMQWENWLFGVQIEYFIPIACISSGLVISFTRLDARLKLILCMLLAIISTYSSINGFLCWIVLYPVYYFSGANNNFFKKWPAISAWLFATIFALFFYFYGYQKPEAQPSLLAAFNHPLDALYYFFGTIGNTIRVIHSIDIIIVVGGVLIIVFLSQIIYVGWNIKDQKLMRNSSVWIMLGLYSLLTAAMLTIGRSGYGILQSCASRYTSFTLYVGVAVIFLASIIIHHHSRGTRISYIQKIGIAVLIAFLIFTKTNTYPVALKELKAYHASILHAKAGLLFINFFPHDQCENKIYPSNFAELQRKANILDSWGYLRPALIKTNVLQDIEGEGSGIVDYGSFDFLFPLGDNYYVASGYAVMPNTKRPADAILLTYENEKGQSILFGLSNSDKKVWYWFISVASIPCNPIEIKAWAFDANTAKAYRLRGSKIVNKLTASAEPDQ